MGFLVLMEVLCDFVVLDDFFKMFFWFLIDPDAPLYKEFL